MIRLACLITTLIALGAEDFNPFAHPASSQRRVTAYTEPIRVLELGSETAGRVAAISVDVGDIIADDGAVIRLDTTLIDLSIAQADAALAAAAAAVAIRKLDQQRLQIEADYAEREFTRIEGLAAEDRTSAQVRDARALDRDRARLALTSNSALIQSVEADLAAAQARLAEAQERRKRHEVHAPKHWVVTHRLREIGALVAIGEPILRLADVSELVLTFRLDEAEVAALRAEIATGNFTLRFQAMPEPVPAKLRRIDVTFDPVSRKRLVEITVPGQSAPEASGGLAAELVLNVADGTGALAVPTAYVTWRLERAVLRDANGTEHLVIPLRRHQDHIIIAADAIPAGTLLAQPN